MKALIIAALAASAALSACSTSTTITSAICLDANTLQSSTIKLNHNQSLALNGVVSTCNATQGGTVFTNTTIAAALINDALLLQSSGLFSELHITAEVPENQIKLRMIRARWEGMDRVYRWGHF